MTQTDVTRTVTPGPVEIVVIAFPGAQFKGDILPELERLVASNTISIIDGLVVLKDADGEITFTEITETTPNADVAALAELVDRVDGLIADEDIEILTEDLQPNSAAGILVFEHTWVKRLREAVIGSGGVLLEDVRVPADVVEEVLAVVAEIDQLEFDEGDEGLDETDINDRA